MVDQESDHMRRKDTTGKCLTMKRV